MIRCEDMASLNFRNERSLGRRSLAGRSSILSPVCTERLTESTESQVHECMYELIIDYSRLYYYLFLNWLRAWRHILRHLCTIFTDICTPWVKKGDTILLSISLLNIDRFSQFFHRRTQLEMCNKSTNKDPTSPQMCCYTTLWNVPSRQRTGAQGTRDNQAAATGDACIHLTWFVASEYPRYQPSILQDLWSDARSRLPEKKWRTWTSWESDWLRSGLDCNRTWLTMPSTSGADACVHAFGLEEDILSICCDWLH